MRKKYLSALLFGALLFASAGTFTSCKDYDDDINNLQSQVDGVKADLEDLQAQINAGKWITNVAAIEGGFTVTFSDGQSFNIVNGENGAAGAAGTQITIGEDGYWYFDGEKSEYLAVANGETGKTNVPYVDATDGYWYFFNEEGEAVKSAYKAVGAAYAVAANGGYNLYLPNEEGVMNEPIFLPGAAAAMTSIDAELMKNADPTATDGSYIDGQAGNDETINIKKYAFDTEANKTRWKDLTGKDLTSNEIILTSSAVIGARINPVDVQATDVDFSLTNSKKETLPGVIFKATEYKDYVTSGNVGSRADYGNGLYTLTMTPLEVKDGDALTNNYKLTVGNSNILYALNAENACLGKYQFGVFIGEEKVNIESYLIDNDKDNPVKAGTETLIKDATKAYTFKTPSDASDKSEYEVYGKKVDAKIAHSVSTEDMSEIYDMWLTAEDYDVDLFDLTFDQEKHTFTINADPDSITKAYFDLTVHTINNNGEYHAKTITIEVSNKIVADAEYATREWTIVNDKDNDQPLKNKNAFFADMKTMTDGLGDQLAAWQRKVDEFEIKYFTDAECKNAVTMKGSAVVNKNNDTNNSGIDLIFTNADNNEIAAIKDATNMKFAITNADASQAFSVDKVYYAQITFYAENDDALNTIVVPFEFSIPELSTLFAIRDGYVVDNVINAYFYQVPANTAKDEPASAAVELERYFSKYVADANVEVTGKIGNEECTKLFAWNTFGASTNTNVDSNNKKQIFATLKEDGTLDKSTTLELVNGIKDGKPDKAYGEAVTVKVTKDNYYGWAYQAEGADEYSFQIRLMSPVYEGSIAVLNGERVIVSANDFVNGANITEKDVEGRDYAGNNLYIFPDAEVGKKTWKNQQIWDVSPSVDEDHYIEKAVMTNATQDKDKNLIKGVINIQGRSLSNDTDIDLPVTIKDAWGYELDVTIPVTVTVGK